MSAPVRVRVHPTSAYQKILKNNREPIKMDCFELSSRFIDCIKRPHIDNKKDKIKCKPEFDAYIECVKMTPPKLILSIERFSIKN